MKAVILAGGAITATPELQGLVAGAAVVVAADSGLRHARALGLTPQLIVGDFDSVSPDDLATYPALPRETHPKEKDTLDLELALPHALEQGVRELVIVGGLGGRLDQTLAALLIAARLQAEGHSVTLHSGGEAAYPLAAGRRLELDLPVGQPFSVLSLKDASTISIEGAKYSLEHARLPFGSGLGVSNEVSAVPLALELHDGLAVLVLEGLA